MLHFGVLVSSRNRLNEELLGMEVNRCNPPVSSLTVTDRPRFTTVGGGVISRSSLAAKG
jgi:hypothetical protein